SRDDEREILLGLGSLAAVNVFDHVASSDSNQILAWQRFLEMHCLDIIDIVTGRSTIDRFAFDELVAAIKFAVGPEDFQIQIVYQRRNGRWQSWDISVGQGDF